MHTHNNFSLMLRRPRLQQGISFYFTMMLMLIHLQLSSEARVAYYDQKQGNKEDNKLAPSFIQSHPQLWDKRTLVGSSPPKCFKRCGSCSPCKSAVVPIHINAEGSLTVSSESEYYPVAWRCQCGGKTYNPYCC